MGFLRRLLGGRGSNADGVAPLDDAALEAEEKAYELELLREDQERMSDLTRRQQQYADHAWKPPAQGDGRRSGDEPGDVPEELA